jgi:hypothetical protein
VEALQLKLRQMGVAIDGPANGFCDNESVIASATVPTSMLKKRHNQIAYHKIREAVAAKWLRLCHIPGEHNTADILTKFLTADKKKQLAMQVLH